MPKKDQNLPIINCHAHVFKAGHVPPFLAKTIVPSTFYKLLYTPLIIKYLRWERKLKGGKYTAKAIKKRRQKLKRRFKLKTNKLYQFLSKTLYAILVINAIIIFLLWFNIDSVYKLDLKKALVVYKLLPFSVVINQVLLLIVSLVLSRNFRAIIKTLFKKIKTLFIGNQTEDLIKKYKTLARFSLYKHQRSIFSAMKDQYPPDTKFVVLPMDMKYMKAGKIHKQHDYYSQMEALKQIKNGPLKDVFLPFVFVDPRRLIEEGQKHFDYSQDANGNIKLNPCFIKNYVEGNNFHGFKIYPALGYFPFDEALLPLWKYAADQQLPIMTHCIKGTVFYRGTKKPEWYEHPVFKEYADLDDEKYAELLLPNEKNIDFQTDFTHPLNYLVLLDETLLRRWVAKCSDKTKQLFGYTNIEIPLLHDLSKLKLCFAHFGGEDQWKNYLEHDFENNLSKNPYGVDFMYTRDRNFSWRKLEMHWKHTNWYTLICSMMLQYDNVYADISYILHNPKIYGLLSSTLKNPKLKEKVLFGTDFYVVRNHNSEKGLQTLANDNLSEEDFNYIARYNPVNYISNNLIN